MKFIIEIEDKALEELRTKMLDADVNIAPDDTSEVIEHLFYVELGMYGAVDVRDKVKVKLIEEPIDKLMRLVETLDPDNKGFQKVFDETNGFEGMSIDEIKTMLQKRYEWDDEKIRLFGLWFTLLGLREGWLLDESW